MRKIEDLFDINELYQEYLADNITLQDVADKYNICNYSTISAAFKRNNLKLKSKRRYLKYKNANYVSNNSPIGIIYMASFSNGKSYIGQTINLENRKLSHKSDAFNVKSKSYNSKFYNAIRKYGFNNIEWIIIEKDIPLNNLNLMEIKYIFNFNTYKCGYNTTEGGDNPPSQLGRKNPNVSKSNNSRIGNKHPFYRKNIANKIRSKYWEIIKPNGDKEVIRNLNQYCKDNNLQQSIMWSISKGKRKQHKGYKCKELKE